MILAWKTDQAIIRMKMTAFLASLINRNINWNLNIHFHIISILSGITVNAPDFKIIIGLLILIILLFGSALMSASEVAYFSFSQKILKNLNQIKTNKSKTALKLYNNPEKLLSTILVANNTINIAIVLLAAFISSRLFDFSSEPVIGFIS